MRIDAHHIFSATRGPAGLWPILERNRFEGSVLIQPAASTEATEAALAQALELDFIKGVSAWVDLAKQDLDLLQSNPKFCGVCVALDGVLDLREAANRDLTVDICLKTHQFKFIEATLEQAHGARLVLEDLGNPEISVEGFEKWAFMVENVARFETVSMKLSGLPSLAGQRPWNAANLKPFVQHAINCFGPERLLFGSGWPDILEQGTWKESLAAFTQSIGAHSIDFREKLLGANAKRVYRLAM